MDDHALIIDDVAKSRSSADKFVLDIDDVVVVGAAPFVTASFFSSVDVVDVPEADATAAEVEEEDEATAALLAWVVFFS